LRMDNRSISTPLLRTKGPIVGGTLSGVAACPGLDEWPWNQWSNARGTAGRISVESLVE